MCCISILSEADHSGESNKDYSELGGWNTQRIETELDCGASLLDNIVKTEEHEYTN